MNCNNSNNNNYNCGSGCSSVLSGRCLKYSDMYLETLGIGAGDNLNSALIKVNNYIQSIPIGGLNEVSTGETSTIALSGKGIPSDPLVANFVGPSITPTLQQVTSVNAVTNVPLTITATGVSLALSGRVSGQEAINSNEFITLSQAGDLLDSFSFSDQNFTI